MGEGAPGLALTITPYELFRGMLSRRSRAQMSVWDWQGSDPMVAMGHVTVFGIREDDQPIP
jgi:hypothetical protein